MFSRHDDSAAAAPRASRPAISTLEECSGCGVSAWGWKDDGWGAKDRTSPIVLRFPQGFGRIRIQTREDGVSLDQVALSAKTYLTGRPGTARNDSLILPRTVPFD